jgi:hypothetical protein
MTWPVLYDGPGGPAANEYAVGSLPTIALVDNKGLIRYYYSGSPETETLDTAIEKLVQEAESDPTTPKP